MSAPPESTSPLSSNSSASDEVSTLQFHYCGLENLGETCYSNACVQALYTLNKVRSLLIESRVTGGPFHVSLGELYHDMAQSQLWPGENGRCYFPYIRPDEFNAQLRLVHPEFVLDQQHDAQECLSILLDRLHQEKNQVMLPSPDVLPPRNRTEAWLYHQTYIDTSQYAKIFMGQMESQLSCNSCSHRSITWSYFWQLQLHLPAEPDETETEGQKTETLTTVNDCIRQLMADEILQGDCAPTCDGCNQRNGSTKKQTVCQAPLYLIVHLKRFSANGEKIDLKVPFDEHLSLANRYYMLTACVMHDGTETKGHYTTLYFEDDNRWVLFDDEKVLTLITDQRAREMMEQLGYIGFYRAVVIG